MTGEAHRNVLRDESITVDIPGLEATDLEGALAELVALAASGASPEDIATAVADYLTANPVEGSFDVASLAPVMSAGTLAGPGSYLVLNGNQTLPSAASADQQRVAVVAGAGFTLSAGSGDAIMGVFPGAPVASVVLSGLDKIILRASAALPGWVCESATGPSFAADPELASDVAGVSAAVAALGSDQIRNARNRDARPRRVFRSDSDDQFDSAWIGDRSVGVLPNGIKVRIWDLRPWGNPPDHDLRLQSEGGDGSHFHEIATETMEGLGVHDRFEVAVMIADGLADGQDRGTEWLFYEFTPGHSFDPSPTGESFQRLTAPAPAWPANVLLIHTTADQTATFYVEAWDGEHTEDDGTTWRELGSVTHADLASIAAPAPVDEEAPEGPKQPFATGYTMFGDWGRVQVTDPVTDAVLANPDPSAITPGAASFTDSAGIEYTAGSATQVVELRAGYTPAVPTDWSPAPTTVAAALDQLAARVATLEP